MLGKATPDIETPKTKEIRDNKCGCPAYVSISLSLSLSVPCVWGCMRVCIRAALDKRWIKELSIDDGSRDGFEDGDDERESAGIFGCDDDDEFLLLLLGWLMRCKLW